MKKLITVLAASTALTGSILAGQPTVQSKMVTPAIEYFGTGWYGAIDGGVNMYQSAHGSDRFESATSRAGSGVTGRRGNTVRIENSGSNVGGFGGLKLGYVFGESFVRPALEVDAFYNGMDVSHDIFVNGDRVGSASSRIDSGAFLANSLLRFSFDRFQPYVGFGLGAWVAPRQRHRREGQGRFQYAQPHQQQERPSPGS